MNTKAKVNFPAIFSKIREFASSNAYLIIPILGVIFLFSNTLNRPWMIYDENILYNESLFPILNSFGEVIEFIKNFGLNFSFQSSNTIYSTNYVTRNLPLAQLLGIMTNFLIGKSAFGYHLLNLVLHLINTSLVFLILKIVFSSGLIKDDDSKKLSTGNLFLITLLTTLWAIHPANVEAVMLSTNFPATISYIFYFALLRDFLLNSKSSSILRKILIPILFLISMLTAEYLITLPLMIFLIAFTRNYKENPFLISIFNSIKTSLPYIIGLAIYVIYYFLISNYGTNQVENTNGLLLFFERVFWLAPQIIFHTFKLIVYPATLTIDQTLFVKYGKTILDPYTIFCFLFVALFLAVPGYFFLFKKKFENLFLFSFCLFIAILPFSHILMPSYTLSAERYLYLPIAIVLVCILNIVRETNKEKLKPFISKLLPALLVILCVLSFNRAHARTLDWSNNFSFIKSSYRTSNDPLYKAMRLGLLGKAIQILDKNRNSTPFFHEALTELESAKKLYLSKKNKYQNTLPEIIKSYGLDYDSTLTKIAYLEASTRFIELKQGNRIALSVLMPYIKEEAKINPSIAELYSHLFLVEGNIEVVKKILLTANKNYPKNPTILSKLYTISLNYESDFEQAEKYLSELLKYYTHDLNVLTKALFFYGRNNNLEKLAKYSYLYAIRTNSTAAYQQALQAYIGTEDFNKSKKILSKLLKENPDNSYNKYLASKFYYSKGEKEKSLKYLKTAYLGLSNSVNPIVAYKITTDLAKLYIQLKNTEEAVEISKRAINFTGNDANRLNELANLYKTLGQTEYYNHCIKKLNALKENSNSPNA